MLRSALSFPHPPFYGRHRRNADPDADGGNPAGQYQGYEADILAAYQELVKRYEAGAVRAKDKERIVQKAKEEAVIKQASGYTVEKIVQGCGNKMSPTEIAGCRRQKIPD